MDIEPILVYTDGSCLRNPGGPGGIGIILCYRGKHKEIAQGFRATTNNRMELTAALVGLRAIKRKDLPVVLYSDSRYLVDGFVKGQYVRWLQRHFKNVLNVDLWVPLIDLVHSFAQPVQFLWVKAHHTNAYNNRCDTIARLAAKHQPVYIDEGYSPTQ